MEYFCSWSGGKDSCLALHRAMKQWGPPACLFNMLTEDGERSRSHGLSRELLEAQASALGVPIVFGQATWDAYEETFVECLTRMSADGVEAGVFGDIDLDEHREWEDRVCARADMTAHLPLWREDHEGLIAEFIEAGFQAVVVTLDTNALSAEYLGRTLDADLVADLHRLGVDVSGEGGEFHTAIVDGPIFSHRVSVTPGDIHHILHYAALDLQLEGSG